MVSDFEEHTWLHLGIILDHTVINCNQDKIKLRIKMLTTHYIRKIAKKQTQQDTPKGHAHARQLDQNCLAREKMGGREGGKEGGREGGSQDSYQLLGFPKRVRGIKRKK